MRLARKLFLLGVMALAALAMTAGTASAQIQVHEEPSGDDCTEVELIGGHETSGGCHAEFESEGNGVPLFAYIPAKTLVSNCNVHLELQVGESGEGYVTNAVFTDFAPGSCTRAPCDEANGTQLVWPVHIRENAGAESVEATFCIRTIASGVGGPPANCAVHLTVTEPANHHYEIGTGSETFCEVSPFPFPVSIQAHLESEEDPLEEIEIIH